MRKITFLLFLLFLTANYSFAYDKIVGYDESSLPVLNDNWEKANSDVRGLESDITDINTAATDDMLISVYDNNRDGVIEGAQLGTGTTGDTVYLRGDKTWQLISGITISQVNDTDAWTVGAATIAMNTELTLHSVNKTITSGRTVILIVAGEWYTNTTNLLTLKLKYGSTEVQSLRYVSSAAATTRGAVAMCGVVTGLSGSTTFTVTGQRDGGEFTGNTTLIVLEI